MFRLKSARQSVIRDQLKSFEENEKRFNSTMEQPLIIAIKSPTPESALILLERGADPNVITATSYTYMQNPWSKYPGQSALDVVSEQLGTLLFYKEPATKAVRPLRPDGIDTYLEKFQEGTYQHWVISDDIRDKMEDHQRKIKKYEEEEEKSRPTPGLLEKDEAIKKAIATLEKIEAALLAKGAKTFTEIYPDYKPDYSGSNNYTYRLHNSEDPVTKSVYEYFFTFQEVTDVTKARQTAYLEL